MVIKCIHAVNAFRTYSSNAHTIRICYELGNSKEVCEES